VKRRPALSDKDLDHPDGKTVRLDYYNNESQALEAAGVSE
jgi:hypothetical protein